MKLKSTPVKEKFKKKRNPENVIRNGAIVVDTNTIKNLPYSFLKKKIPHLIQKPKRLEKAVNFLNGTNEQKKVLLDRIKKAQKHFGVS